MRSNFKWSLFLLLAYALLFACGGALMDASGPLVSTSKLHASVVVSQKDVKDGKLSMKAIYPGSCLTESIGDNGFAMISDGCRMQMQWDSQTFFFAGKTVDHESSNVPVNIFKNATFNFGNVPNLKMPCGVRFKPNNNTEQGGYVVDFRVEDIKKTCSDIEIVFSDRYELYVPPSSSATKPGENGNNTALIVSLSVLGFLLFLAALGVFLYCCWWKKRGLKQDAPGPTQVLVPAQKPKANQINRIPNMPEVTAVSKTHLKATQPKPTPFPVPAPVPTPVPTPALAQVSAPVSDQVSAPVSDQVSAPMPTAVPAIDKTPQSEKEKRKLRTIAVSRVPTPIIIRGSHTMASEEMSEKLYGGLHDYAETRLVPNTIEMEAFDRKRDRSRRNAKAVDEGERKRKRKKYLKK